MMKKVVLMVLLLLVGFVNWLQAKNIVILATGGTIAGVADKSTQTVGYKASALAVDTIIKSVPELRSIKDLKITGEQVLQITSQNFNAELWLKLAKRVNQLIKSRGVDGIIITHGTDTIEETAYFLSLVIKTDKPIVIVGAMRPTTSISADGAMNLYNAALVANADSSKGKGVLVVFNDTIISAREVTKSNNFKVEAFTATGGGVLGYIHSGDIFYVSSPVGLYGKNSEFNIENINKLPVVDIFYGYPGANYKYINLAVELKIDGIVYAGTGNGSMNDEVEKAARSAQKAGVVILRASRVMKGRVARNGEVADDEANFIVAKDLSPQKARILLMLGLTKNKDTKYLQELFNKY